MDQLSLHILDLVQNSLEAEATSVSVRVQEDLDRDRLTIQVVDNGRGMDVDIRCKAVDPFFTTRKTRHVGLGLPLLQAAAEACEGCLTVESRSGEGTAVTACFQHSHIDRMPLGDMPKTLMTLLLMTGRISFHYLHQVNAARFEFRTDLFREVLGDEPFSTREVREWFRQFVIEGEDSVQREFHHAETDESGGITPRTR